MLTDSLRREDSLNDKAASFQALPEPVQRALLRAARYRKPEAVVLPEPVDPENPELGSYIMVPTRKGLVQMAYQGLRAWRL